MKIIVLSEGNVDFESFQNSMREVLVAAGHEAISWALNDISLPGILECARATLTVADGMLVMVENLSDSPGVAFLVGAAIGLNIPVYSFDESTGSSIPGTMSLGAFVDPLVAIENRSVEATYASKKTIAPLTVEAVGLDTLRARIERTI